MPKYAVIKRQSVTGGEMVTAKLYPDTEFEHSFQEEVLKEVETPVEVDGKVEMIKTKVRSVETLIKSDFNEVQTYFVGTDEDEAVVLSLAAHNHEDGVAALKLKSEEKPLEKLVEEVLPADKVDAIKKKDLAKLVK